MQKFKHGFAAIAYTASAAVLKNFRACLYLMIKPWYRKSKVLNPWGASDL